MFDDMNNIPFHFMGMPWMFPFMQGMNNTADTTDTADSANGQQGNGQQANGFPFPFGMMPPMMFPYFMYEMRNMANSANGQQTNGQQANGFPFGMMGQQTTGFPFPFGMMGQQANGFPFPFGMMPPMMFPFMQGMNGNADKEENNEQDGFSFMGVTIPKTLLQKLLNMDWNPGELDKLQKVIDMIYAKMPKK